MRAFQCADKYDQAEILRRAAEDVVTLRTQLLSADGLRDWTGRTYTYRETMRAIFDSADLHGQERRRVQARLAHHVSVALHSRAPAGELGSKGLRDINARGRSVERYRNVAAILERLEAEHARLAAAGDPQAELLRRIIEGE